MPLRRAHIDSPCGDLTAALESLREEHDVPEGFPPEVIAEAETAAQAGPTGDADVTDLRDVPFVTIDPKGSRDLDQAFHIERTADGYVLRYAIADVPGFVNPGGAIDAEARQRGQTLYLPDGSVPLHPPILSEGRVSLLPDEDRTAYVWTIPVDASGAAALEGADVPAAQVERALIRSRAQLDYETQQAELDAGTASDPIELLREFGLLRIEQEQVRGGASLNMPDEAIIYDEHGFRIERRAPLPLEDWNAQLSLLTGMAAARMMLDGGIGVLRTMPAPEEEALAEFHARVAALGLPWDESQPYGEYLRMVPRDDASDDPRRLAVLHAAASLFRGADYAVFGPGLGDPPDDPEQAAIAAPYAHVSAPLRRLVDRWGLVICESLCSNTPIPDWVLECLAEVPALMRSSSQRAGQLNSAALDRVEAALLCDRVGEEFTATVIDVSSSSARVQFEDPPVSARVAAEDAESVFTAGQETRVRVARVDIASGEIELEPALSLSA